MLPRYQSHSRITTVSLEPEEVRLPKTKGASSAAAGWLCLSRQVVPPTGMGVGGQRSRLISETEWGAGPLIRMLSRLTIGANLFRLHFLVSRWNGIAHVVLQHPHVTPLLPHSPPASPGPQKAGAISKDEFKTPKIIKTNRGERKRSSSASHVINVVCERQYYASVD